MMRTRNMLAGVLMVGGFALACSDTFSVEDALGIWDAQRINGDAIPGTVWARGGGGSDSIQVTLAAARFEFMAAPDCEYTIQLQGEDPLTSDVCTYAIAEDGTISLTVNVDYDLTGTADGDDMTLTDEDTNVWELRRRQ